MFIIFFRFFFFACRLLNTNVMLISFIGEHNIFAFHSIFFSFADVKHSSPILLGNEIIYWELSVREIIITKLKKKFFAHTKFDSKTMMKLFGFFSFFYFFRKNFEEIFIARVYFLRSTQRSVKHFFLCMCGSEQASDWDAETREAESIKDKSISKEMKHEYHFNQPNQWNWKRK